MNNYNVFFFFFFFFFKQKTAYEMSVSDWSSDVCSSDLDGKTTSGCWIYTGVTVEGPDGKVINKANARKPADAKDYLGHGWGFSWPANRRILYNRASADLKGHPWSEKKKLI